MEFNIKPLIFIVLSLVLLWQILKWFIPFVFVRLMSYIRSIVLDEHSSIQEKDYFH
jgi:hypothetical protein